mmetsp:Transcript_24803/g.63947  ORF Transcript_24803/g.63947 Transcript_24803/m.63947 type:complete len:638 (+) Transcript_24803:91-2004(+)
MRSALTQSLVSGKPSEPQGTKPSRTLGHAFPCIAYGAGEDDASERSLSPASSDTHISQALDALELDKLELVGSAPSAGLEGLTLDGKRLADYQINPRRRRGGQEALPEMVNSLNERWQPSGSVPQRKPSGNWGSVIGSLPPGLTDEERMKVRMSVPPSPSAALLKELNPDAVTGRTLNGRKLRRKVLAGAVLVFITAGYSGKRFIFEKAHQLGVKSVVLDAPDSWVQVLEKEGKIAKFIPVDFTDAETVFERCMQGIKRAVSEVGELDGVTTFCELAVPLAVRIAEKLGLPHNTPDSIDFARDKHKARELMQQAGLPTPKHHRITKAADVQVAAEVVGFPAVIKPVSGAASIGVMRVDNMQQLNDAYARVSSDMRRAKVVAGALSEGDLEEDEQGNAGSWLDLVLMLEEYLDGQEVDVDLIFDNGVPAYGAVTDNWPTVEPYFNETGSNCPSTLPGSEQQELCELAVRSVQALGLSMGVFHVELKQTSRGPRLIEINCRMGGGPVRDINLLVWGVDLVEENLYAHVGIPVRPFIARQPLKQIAEYSINAQVTGILRDTEYLKPWQNHPEVLYARPLVEPGHKCVSVADGLPTWVCEIMVTKPKVQDAITFIKDIAASLDIPISPKPMKHLHGPEAAH